MRVAFSGSRYRSARGQIEKILREYDPRKDIVVHGGCSIGIDKEVDEIARKLGFRVVVFYPRKPEPKYYLKRNREMAKYADILYAFPKSKETGELALRGIVTRGGTEHTIRQFIKLGKPVIVL